MKQMKPKSKPRMARGNTDYGLVRRVAQRLGLSESWVSAVKNGVEQSEDVTAAIKQEREAMRKERRSRHAA